MRKFLIIGSAFVSFIFLIAFVGTFFLKDKIYESARNLAVERTSKYAGNVVSSAEELLQSPLAKKVLSEQQLDAISGEIETYNVDPVTFVTQLTSENESPPPSGFKNKLSRKFFGWKESLRKHYNETLSKLIGDLRLFCATNVVAGLLGVFLAFKSRDKKPGILLIYGGILLFSIGMGVSAYIDHMSILNLLINGFMGWEYPVFILSVFLFIYWYFGRHVASNIENSSR